MKIVFITKQKIAKLAYVTGLLSLVLAVTFSLPAGRALAAALDATAPSLGNAESYAVLGAETVTNTGNSIINGDLGLHPGTSVTGFPPGIINGEEHITDADALSAKNDATTAFFNLGLNESTPCDQDLSGTDLGGLTLTPGVYCFSSSAQLTGTLTLDAQGNEWSVFIFKIGSTLTTASASSVEIINAENLCNVFWRVGSSATLGTTTAFKGNILANDSITLNNDANIIGRALALTGAVTLDDNTITIPVCAVPPTTAPTTAPTTGTAGESSASTPAPEALPDTGGNLAGPGSQAVRISLGALGLSLLLVGFILSRKTQKVER